MKTIFVTGAKGFIGNHLSSFLSSINYNVYGLGHGVWPDLEIYKWGLKEWINGDVNSENLSYLLKRHGCPAIIFHLAGGSSVNLSIKNPSEDFFRTVVATAKLLEWVRQESPSTKLVIISSAAVYGSGHDKNISEAEKLRPYSPYGYHKMMMEELCKSYSANYGLSSVVVRLFSVYGSELRKQLMWDICSRLFKGESHIELNGTGNEMRDWTEIRDVVRLLEQAAPLANETVPIINGGSGIATPIKDIASRILEAWDSSARINFSGHSRVGDPINLVSVPTRINTELFDWKVKLDEGIPNYVSWFKQVTK